MLTVIDEHTRECIAIHVQRKLKHDDVLAVREWLEKVKVQKPFFTPSSPWGNGYNETFNSKLRDELLNGEIFYTLKEAQILIKCGRLFP